MGDGAGSPGTQARRRGRVSGAAVGLAAVVALLLLAGAVLQVRDGVGAGPLALAGLAALAVVAAALRLSLGQRRRLEQLLVEQARAAERDVELERARQRADRWASMGKLAEGVAHDVNSPLGSLRSNLAYVREEIAAGRAQSREVDEAIEDSLQALERIRETVASLTAISVPEEALLATGEITAERNLAPRRP
jgi:signal transduction histidine kinase